MAKIAEGIALVVGDIALGLFTFGGSVVADALFTELLIGLSAATSFTLSFIAQALTASQQMGFSARQSAAPRMALYGQFRTAGVVIYMDTTGSGESLNQIICWAAHTVESIDTIYLDGRELHLNGSHQGDGNTYTDPSGNQYSFGSVDVEACYQNLGPVPGTFFSSLAGVDGSFWTSNMTLDGLACTYLRLGYDVNRFNGPPNVKASLHGKNNIYDPRSASYGYTNNAALVIADFLCDNEWGVGCNYSTEIDEAQLIAAANICDEQVTLAAGGTESRYTINGTFSTSSAPGEILDALLQCCEGRISYTGGVWKIFPAAWYGSSLSLDENSLVDRVQWMPYRKYRDLVNCVRGTYICPQYPYSVIGYDQDHKDTGIFNGEWQATDFPQYQQDPLHGYTGNVWLTQDGNVSLYATRSYKFVTSVAMAQRLAKIYLLRNRFQGSGTLRMSMNAYQMQAQDVFEFTCPTLDMTDQYLEVQNFRLVPKLTTNEDGTQSPTISCELVVNQTDPSIYDWSDVEEMTVTAGQSPAFADPYTVQPPTALTLTSGQAQAVIGIDGVITPRILVTWTSPADPFVASGGFLEIQWQVNGSGSWTGLAHVSATTNAFYLTGIVSGQSYNVQMRSNRANGATSAWVEAGPEQAVSTGSLVSYAHGTNAVSNPGFELNILGGAVGDGWIVDNAQNTLAGLFNAGLSTVDSHGGAQNLLIRVEPNISIPNGSTLGIRINSGYIPISGGGALYYGGWIAWVFNIALNTNLTILQRAGMYFYDATYTFITEQYVQIDNVQDSTWQQISGTYNAPSNAAFVVFMCSVFVGNSSGSTQSTPNGLCADCRFDDVFLIQQTGSGLFTNQGSVQPTQSIEIPYTVTSSSVTFTWSRQSILRSDGSTLTILNGSLTYSGLSASTEYYTYWYADPNTGTLYQTNGSPPGTSPNSLQAAQAGLDGRLLVDTISFTTTASGSGSGTGGGGDICPEENEEVEVRGLGIIRAGDVKAGDWIRGFSFTQNKEVYRRVRQVKRESARAWRIVQGHRVSPCEPVYVDGQWKAAYLVSAEVDTFAGWKVAISVEAQEDKELNYYLKGSSGHLLIHNIRISPC